MTRTMDAFFTVEDFISEVERSFSVWPRVHPEDAAARANAILREFFEKAPKIFSGPEKNLGGVCEEWSLAEFEGEDTHVGRLVFVEEIGK